MIIKYSYAALHLPSYYNKKTILEGELQKHKTLVVKDTSVKKEKSSFAEVFTISFNNYKVIEYQIRSLLKYFNYPFRYTVFDNSNDDNSSKKIKEICIKYSVNYVKLPKQPFLFKGMGSYSHGIACNFAFRNYIQKSDAKYAALLDHDIFCIEEFSIDSILDKQPFYGLVFSYDRAHKKYLWPGYCFLNMNFIRNKKMDFRPSYLLGCDSGVSNYRLYEVPEFNKYTFASMKHIQLEKGNKDILGMGYSLFDREWIHCWNASNYSNKKSLGDKMKIIYEILDKKLE